MVFTDDVGEKRLASLSEQGTERSVSHDLFQRLLLLGHEQPWWRQRRSEMVFTDDVGEKRPASLPEQGTERSVLKGRSAGWRMSFGYLILTRGHAQPASHSGHGNASLAQSVRDW
jgi:hypothetical protein